MISSLTVTAQLRARIALQRERIEHYTAVKDIAQAHHCFINQMRDVRNLRTIQDRLVSQPEP